MNNDKFTHLHKRTKSRYSLNSKSTEYKSFENRDKIRPVGVVSKKDMGALRTESRTLSCNFLDALTPKRARNIERKKVKIPNVKLVRP